MRLKNYVESLSRFAYGLWQAGNLVPMVHTESVVDWDVGSMTASVQPWSLIFRISCIVRCRASPTEAVNEYNMKSENYAL
jgi:hypothetical protein